VSALLELLLMIGATLAVALSGVGLLAARDTALRLHFLAPASSLGVPLMVAALAVDQGWDRTTAKLVLIGVLLVGSGAVTASAIGHAAAQREGWIHRGTRR
jgi:multisubunit Na+/H+ antiporter MnhG subunit